MVDNCLSFIHPATQPLRRLPAIWSRLLGFLAPPRCLLCSEPGHAGIDLCTLCAEMLPRPTATVQQTSATPVRLGAAPRPPPPGCALVVAALQYHWPVDHLVHELKFGGSWPVARVFGHLLASARRPLGAPWPDVIIPVPLHPLRLAERGFNQSEHIARVAAIALGIPLAVGVLQRRRYTATQSRLNAMARRENLHGAFSANLRAFAALHAQLHAPLPAQSRRVALVDDVYTTGSTLAAATHALRLAGIKEVEWWAAARAPPPPERPDQETNAGYK